MTKLESLAQDRVDSAWEYVKHAQSAVTESTSSHHLAESAHYLIEQCKRYDDALAYQRGVRAALRP